MLALAWDSRQTEYRIQTQASKALLAICKRSWGGLVVFHVKRNSKMACRYRRVRQAGLGNSAGFPSGHSLSFQDFEDQILEVAGRDPRNPAGLSKRFWSHPAQLLPRLRTHAQKPGVIKVTW